MSSVGCGAKVGIHPISEWNNPEPEVVLAVRSDGVIVGAALGNDVNLRDVEGRSALLLGKAKDNNASCAIGPFIRLFDDGFTLSDLENAKVSLKVEGQDGFTMTGESLMSAISRKPSQLVGQLLNRNHQYPDGAVLSWAPCLLRSRTGAVLARASRMRSVTAWRLRHRRLAGSSIGWIAAMPARPGPSAHRG